MVSPGFIAGRGLKPLRTRLSRRPTSFRPASLPGVVKQPDLVAIDQNRGTRVSVAAPPARLADRQAGLHRLGATTANFQVGRKVRLRATPVMTLTFENVSAYRTRCRNECDIATLWLLKMRSVGATATRPP